MNSDIWLLACAEVRQSERKLRSQAQETDLMLKWKDNEHKKFNAQLEELHVEVLKYRQEMSQLEEERPQQSKESSSKFDHVEHKLQALDRERQQYYQDQVISARQELSQLLVQQGQQPSDYNNTKMDFLGSNMPPPQQGKRLNSTRFVATIADVDELKARFHQLSASSKSLQTLIQNLEKRLTQDRNQFLTIQHQIHAMASKWLEEEFDYSQQSKQAVLDVFSLEGILLDVKLLLSSLPHYQQHCEETNLQMRAIDEQIKITNTTLLPLQQSMYSNQNSTSCTSHVVSSDELNCPACGQHLPGNSSVIAAKVQEMESILIELLQQRRNLDNEVHAYKRLLNISQQLTNLYKEQEMLQRSIHEKESEQNQYRLQWKQVDDKLQNVQYELKQAQHQQAAQQAIHQESIAATQRRLEAAEERYQQYTNEYEEQKLKLSQLKQSVDVAREEEMRFNQTFYEVNSKLQLQQTLVQDKEQMIQQCQQEVQALELEKKGLHDRQQLLDQLVLLFGPKGIQHYLFQSAISQLEVLANNYLLILSDGGIRLQLKSDVEQERVLKTVLMRSLADGQWRERGLAQLSGGQWRRVSLALDLAFTELVRRRGILRFNVMIMDEILTHLDAAGRESVGSVLKALVENESSNEGINSVRSVEEDYEVREVEEERRLMSNALTDSCYETILVILQDLVATELEESFDHIDVVVKEGDASRVILDGGIDS